MSIRQQFGITLIELLVVIAVLAIVLGIAVPSFKDTVAKRRVEGIANEMSSDISYARSQSISDNSTVTFITTAKTYAIAGNQNYKTVQLDSTVSVSPDTTITFSALRGCTNATCAPSTNAIRINSSRVSSALTVRVNALGRTEICAPAGTSFTGYVSC